MDIIIEKLGEIGVAIIFMLPAIGTFSELLYKTMTQRRLLFYGIYYKRIWRNHNTAYLF